MKQQLSAYYGYDAGQEKTLGQKNYDLSVSDVSKLKPFSGLNMENNLLKYQILLNVY